MWFIRDVLSEIRTNFVSLHNLTINRFKRWSCNRNRPLVEVHYEQEGNEIVQTAAKCKRCNLPIFYSTDRMNVNDADAIYEQLQTIQKTPCVR